MTADDLPEEPIDLAKIRRALDVRRTLFARGRRFLVAPEHIALDHALVEYGCFGTWPDVRPLVRGLRNYGSHLSQSDKQTFADFDQLLDRILEQAAGLETEQE